MIEDFYPTPVGLIEKMLEGISIGSVKEVLEPSAGKGDICDFLAQMPGRGYERNNVKIDAIEINPDLQKILIGKKHRLIHDDFLTFETSKSYDLIVANFPFSDGAAHLEKALQLIRSNGGKLICLVNAETVRNTFSLLRSELVKQIDDLNGEITFLKDEFLNAERKTAVEVALVVVEAKLEETDSLILEGMKKAKQVEAEEKGQTELVPNNYIAQAVAGFRHECKLGINLINEWFALKPLMKNRFTKPGESDYSSQIIELTIKGAYSSKQSFYNEYLEAVRAKYWSVLINDSRFKGKYTSNIQELLERKMMDLRDYDFTEFNIRKLEEELSAQIGSGIESAILKMFDEFSSKYSMYPETENNVHYYNGWCANSAHKINMKIILPMNGFSSNYGGKVRINDSYIQKRLTDIIKVFNYLSDQQSNVFRLVGDTIEKANQASDFRNMDFRYFETTFYKKGTCHIKFKDEMLVEKLNIFGSQRKKWLPPNYGKTKYADMTAEEKEIINDFQGERKYNEVVKNSLFYLVTPKQLLLESAKAGSLFE